MRIIKFIRSLRPSPRALYAGGKIVLGGLLLKTATMLRTLMGEEENTADASFGFQAEGTLTLPGFIEGTGHAILISGTIDVLTMGAKIIENQICSSKAISDEAHELKIRTRKKKQLRKLESQKAKNKISQVKNSVMLVEQWQQRRDYFLFIRKTLYELLIIGYFIVSLIDPLKKWMDISDEKDIFDKASNSLQERMNDVLKLGTPISLLENVLQPHYAMGLSLIMFSYNLVEIKKTFNRKSDKNYNEIPLAGILNGFGFLILSLSALIKHKKIYEFTKFADAMMSEIIDHGKNENTIKRYKNEMFKIFNKNRNWLMLAKIVNLYGKFKLFNNITETAIGYLSNRQQKPLETRMKSIRNAFIERPKQERIFLLDKPFVCGGKADLPSIQSTAISSFPEEPVNEEARQRKLVERKAREERARGKAEQEVKSKERKIAIEQDAERIEEIEHFRNEIISGIQKNLNPKGQKILHAILSKGSHSNLSDDDIELVFRGPDKQSNLAPFSLKTTSQGTLINFNNKAVTTYHRLHGEKRIHERVFNEIREKFEMLNITESDLDELTSRSRLKIA